jgi:hypothetical protein
MQLGGLMKFLALPDAAAKITAAPTLRLLEFLLLAQEVDDSLDRMLAQKKENHSKCENSGPICRTPINV